jgi:hypothetical protein
MSKQKNALIGSNVERRIQEVSLATLIAVALSACGGGGSSNLPTSTGTNPNTSGGSNASNAQQNPATVASNDLVITGTVATGAALANASVTAKCAAGAGNATSTTDGTYSIRIANGALPCVLSALAPNSSSPLNSAIEDSGDRAVTANITTLTQLVFDQINAQASEMLIDNFSTEKSKVTATLLNQAKQKIRESLLSVVDLGNLDPVKDVLVAQSATSSGNAHDVKLDTLRDKLAAAQLTLPMLNKIIADNSNSNTAEVIKTSVQPANADCAGFRSGTYRVIEPANATPVYSIIFNAQTLSAVTPSGTITMKSDGCKLTAPDGTVTVIGPQGAGVMRTAAGTLAAVIPQQSLSLAELQGTWNYVMRARETGTAYIGMWGEIQLDSAGKSTRRENCTSVACSVLSGTQLPTLTANSDGSFSSSQNEKFYAFRASTGVMALIGISTTANDIGKIVYARKGPAPDLSLIDRIYKRADISVSAAGLVSSAFEQTEYLVTAVNPTEKTVNRRFFGLCRQDTLSYGAPFSQMFNRSTATINSCTGTPNALAPVRGVSSNGLGVSAYVLNADTVGFTVIDPPKAESIQDTTVQANVEKMFTSGNGSYQFLFNLPGGPGATAASSASGHYFLKRGVDKIASPSTGTQSTFSRVTLASNTLTAPTPSADDRFSNVVLKSGAIYRSVASQAAVDFRYEGSKVLQDWMGTKLDIPVGNSAASRVVMWTDQYFALPPRKLVGSVSSIPSAISFDSLFTSIYTTPSLLNTNFSTKQWNPGAAYYRVGIMTASDRISVGDCVEGSTFLAMNNPSNPLTCTSGNVAYATLEQAVNGTTVFGGQAYRLDQGDIVANREGVRMWIARAAEATTSTTRYRVYFELGGKVYAGTLTPAGTSTFSTPGSGTNTDVQVRYNEAAVESLKSVFAF